MNTFRVGKDEIYLKTRSRTTYDPMKVIKATAESMEISLKEAVVYLVEIGVLKFSDAKIKAFFLARPEKSVEYWKDIQKDYGIKLGETDYTRPYLQIRRIK